MTVEGKKDLEDGEWTTITTLRTNGQGYVTVSDVGEFRFFRITTTH